MKKNDSTRRTCGGHSLNKETQTISKEEVRTALKQL